MWVSADFKHLIFNRVLTRKSQFWQKTLDIKKNIFRIYQWVIIRYYKYKCLLFSVFKASIFWLCIFIFCRHIHFQTMCVPFIYFKEWMLKTEWYKHLIYHIFSAHVRTFTNVCIQNTNAKFSYKMSSNIAPKSCRCIGAFSFNK